eukprot:1151885-Pelagomonas_calceolata.AAC.1
MLVTSVSAGSDLLLAWATSWGGCASSITGEGRALPGESAGHHTSRSAGYNLKCWSQSQVLAATCFWHGLPPGMAALAGLQPQGKLCASHVLARMCAALLYAVCSARYRLNKNSTQDLFVNGVHLQGLGRVEGAVQLLAQKLALA